MKRSAIVILVIIAGITAMIWSGFMAYRIHRSLNAAPPNQATMAQPGLAAGSAANTLAAAPDTPAAEGLPDLRGKPAPAFTLKTIDGKTVSLSDYKGKAVLVNFWATWCGPCKLEMPWLIDLQKKYAAKGFTVLGISEDDTSPAQVSAFAKQMGVNYPVLIASDAVSQAYGGIDYLPVSYYIGRNGTVVAEVGGVISRQDIDADIQKILATRGA